MMTDWAMLEELYETIRTRKGGAADASYTASLFAKGRAKIAQKVGEEAVELAIASVGESKDAIVAESADLLYHLMVLWVDAGVSPDEVLRRLRERDGVSGLSEKARREA